MGQKEEEAIYRLEGGGGHPQVGKRRRPFTHQKEGCPLELNLREPWSFQPSHLRKKCSVLKSPRL